MAQNQLIGLGNIGGLNNINQLAAANLVGNFGNLANLNPLGMGAIQNILL